MRARYKPLRLQICSVGPGRLARLTPRSKRTGLEERRFALTGRVVGIGLKRTATFTLLLLVRTGDKPGIVVREVSSETSMVEIRNTVFSWTRTKFLFHTSSAKKLNLSDPRSSPFTGRAFFDIGHALKDQSNRRSHLPGYAAWEIHPVMTLHVDQ